jgi:hypothetical protein
MTMILARLWLALVPFVIFGLWYIISVARNKHQSEDFISKKRKNI